MQISIDTEARVIVINGTYTIQELMKTLTELFPDFDSAGWSISDKLPTPFWIDMSQFPGTPTLPPPYIQPWNPFSGEPYCSTGNITMATNEDFRKIGDFLQKPIDISISVIKGLEEKEDL